MTLPLAIPCADAAPAPPFRPRGPKRFGRTPIEALTQLTGNEIKVLTTLEYFARFDYPNVEVSQVQVAAKAGVSRRGVQLAYKRLEATGWIAREHGYRRTHQCAKITLLDPTATPSRLADPDIAPMAQTDDAPMAQKPCTYGAKNGASNAQILRPKTPNPTLYKGFNTEKEERMPPPSNCSTHYDPLRQRPGIQRLHHHNQLCTDFIARLNAGLEPDFFTYDD